MPKLLGNLMLAGLLVQAAVAGDALPAADQEAIRTLQTELVRRVNAQEPVNGLFANSAAATAAAGWRQLLLQGAASSVQRQGELLHTQVPVRLRTETPLTADCPVVEMVLQPGDRVLVWQEQGLLDADYVRTPAGWRIASLQFRPQ